MIINQPLALTIEGHPTVDVMRNLVLLCQAASTRFGLDPQMIMDALPSSIPPVSLKWIMENDRARLARVLDGHNITVEAYNQIAQPLLTAAGHHDHFRRVGHAANEVSFGLEVLQKLFARTLLRPFMTPFALYAELPNGSLAWNTNKHWEVTRMNGSSVMLWCTYQHGVNILDDLLSIMYLIPGMNEEFPRMVLRRKAPLAAVTSLMIAAPINDVINRLVTDKRNGFGLRGDGGFSWNHQVIGQRVYVVKDEHGQYSGKVWTTENTEDSLQGIRITADVTTTCKRTGEELPLLREGMIFQMPKRGDDMLAEAHVQRVRWKHCTIYVKWEACFADLLSRTRLGAKVLPQIAISEELNTEMDLVDARREARTAAAAALSAEASLRALEAILEHGYPNAEIGRRVLETGEILPGQRGVVVHGFAVYLDMVGSEKLTKLLAEIIEGLPQRRHIEDAIQQNNAEILNGLLMYLRTHLHSEGLVEVLFEMLKERYPDNSRQLWVRLTQRFIDQLTRLARQHGLWVYQYMNDGFVVIGTNGLGHIGELETGNMSPNDILEQIINFSRLAHQLSEKMMGRQLRIGIDYGPMAWEPHADRHRIDTGDDPTKLAARVEGGTAHGETWITDAALSAVFASGARIDKKQVVVTKHGDEIVCYPLIDAALQTGEQAM